MRTFRHTGAVVFLASVLLLTPVNIFSCGPFFTEAVFVPKVRPAPTIDPYLAGHLGVVQPTYYRVYLAIAYRVLSGKPFDPSQLASAKLYWTYDQTVNQEGGASVELWNKARASALGEKEKLGPNSQFELESLYRRELNGYNSYINCTPDAFRNAARTLNDRAHQFGVSSATIRDWISAQDAVFSNCSKKYLLPSPAAANADATIKADRNYQVAAAHFYREELDQARSEFLQIAQDRTSPWRTIAPYLAARALVRQATLLAPEDKPADPKLLAQAQAELERILADKKSGQIHAAADSTLGFVEFRLDPTQRLHQLAQRVSGQRRSPELGQDLIDYTRLLDKVSYGPGSAEPGRPPTLQDARADDITDWIFNAASSTPENREHATRKWQQTQSTPWLIAALVQTETDTPDLDQLLSAAAAVLEGSSAYDSATYHRARLLLLRGRTDEARAIADRELQRAPEAPKATRNLYLGLRWQLARDFDEFLKFAPQVPVTYQDTSGAFSGIYCGTSDVCSAQLNPDSTKSTALFDLPVAATLNQRMPVTLLAQAAQSPLLPTDLRNALLISTWTRATILHNPTIARELGREIGRQIPPLEPYVSAYDTAPDEKAREFAATFAMMHFPGMRPYVNGGVLRQTPLAKIDDFRDNWWGDDIGGLVGKQNFEKGCGAWSSWRRGNTPSSGPPGPTVNPASPPILPPAEKAAGDEQWNRLRHLGPAPNYFGEVVLQWASAHPNDTRIPEALALVVRASRYGCNNRDTAKFSKQAFTMLQHKYPNSEWTKKTPHWYE